MYLNNEDIAKQHANLLREELERCRLAEQTRLLHKMPGQRASGAAQAKRLWKSLLETIAKMGRRIL